jgi:outer membrane protein, heavy metal efflux system
MKIYGIFLMAVTVLWQMGASPIYADIVLQGSDTSPAIGWFAQDLVLNQLLARAQATSPELLSRQRKYQAAQRKAQAARALPDPQLSGGMRNVGIGRFTIGSEPMSGASLALQQNYPNPQKLDIKQAIADRQALLLVLDWQWQQKKIRRDIQQHYFKALQQRQTQRVLAEMGHWYALLQKIVETRYQVGKVPLQDVWQVKLRRSELEQQNLVLAQAEQLHWTALRQTLGWPENFQVPSGQTYPVIPALPLLSPTLPDRRHPELGLQRLQTELSRWELKMAEAELESDYFISGGMTQRVTLEMIWELRAGMTLPIYEETKNKPLIDAAELQMQSAEANALAVAQRLQSQWETAYIQWQYSQRQQSLYTDQILPEAKASVESALAAYQGGQRDVAQVIESIARWLGYQEQWLALQAQGYVALSELEYLTSGEAP